MTPPLAAIKAAHAADSAAYSALKPHAQVIHGQRAALLAEVERLRAENAKLRERVQHLEICNAAAGEALGRPEP